MLHRLPSVGLAALSLMLAALPAQCPPLPGNGFDLTGSTIANSRVEALIEMPNGDVIAGGIFNQIGGVAANNIARWDGTAWAPLGSGIGGSLPRVYVMTLDTNGDLLVGGSFSSAGGVTADNLARWTGTGWLAVAAGSGPVSVMAVLPSGDICISIGSWIGRWNGASWTTIGTTQMFGAAGGRAYSMAVHPSGDLLVAGQFMAMNSVTAQGLARWTPGTATWSAVGNYSALGTVQHGVVAEPNGDVIVMRMGSSGAVMNRFDGSWHAMPSPPLDPNGIYNPTYSPHYHPNLTRTAQGHLLATGRSTQGPWAVYEWDGLSWSSPTATGQGTTFFSSAIRAATGTLFIGGQFTGINSVASAGIARLECTTASASSFGDGCYHDLRALYEIFPSGSAFDLSQSTLRFTFDSTGYHVEHAPGAPVFATPTSAPIPLGDDDLTSPIPLPFVFPFPGGSVAEIAIGSNGILGLGSDVTWSPYSTGSSLFSPPYHQLGPMWHDLDPSSASGGGTVHYDVDPSGHAVYATWLNVQEWGNPSMLSTFQIALFDNGDMAFRYQDCAGTLPVLTGWHPGDNPSAPYDHGSVDLTAAGPFHSIDCEAPVLASSLPVLGTTVTFQATDLPATSLLGATVLGLTPIPNGLDLQFLGMPMCRLFTSVDALDVAFLSSGTFTTQLVIPNVSTLSGVQLFAQGIVWATGFNASGMIVTNALDLHLGQ